MSLQAYITDIKTQLSGLGENPAPVIDGPVEFALNSYSEREFICVSETSIGYEPSDSLTAYKYPIDLEISIYVERAPTERTSNHLTRARVIYDDVWQKLGMMKSGGFQIVRTDSERVETDDASSVVFVIRATLTAFQKDTTC